ncbi:GAF and ANTAR domain-containing protein [Streptomyces sp. WMMB 322]|uniref:GAF and ANTAR domain-containing protein n=1 Tax=Streptomyces sp. WMMB 322 TaxID=1286821 RepID=UPI0006E410A8|nr:GAF and ANTAR domain-containing protein [Streptomyces sp. WMMB 322]SCK37570.1 GAF domain-containing protein [Streptomyces sp. WMMB 322]
MRPGGDSDGTDPGEPEEGPAEPEEDDRDRRWRGFVAEAAIPPPDQPADGIPAGLCAACVRLLRTAGGSLSLTGGEQRSHVTLCASDGIAAQLAEIQYTLGEGPWHCATRSGEPVAAADLTAGPDTRRWPVFARHAVEAGAGSAFSFPMSQGSRVLGTVDLYNSGPSTLEEPDFRLGMRAADVLCLRLVSLHRDQPREDEQAQVAWWLDAEANHEEVHRAVGMLMVRLGVDAEEAMTRLRARAFSLGRTVTEVAADVAGGRDDFRAGE